MLKLTNFIVLFIVVTISIPAYAVTFNSNALIDDGNYSYENKDIIINGCVLTVNGAHDFMSVQIINGGTLTHSAANASFDLTITDNVTVDAGALISANGKGHPSHTGPGAGGSMYVSQDSAYGSGAGYGGKGGNANKPGGISYPDIINPDQLGSGGGYASWWSGYISRYYEYGGSGGGKLKLNIGGVLTVDGTISANGNNGESGSAYWGDTWSGGGGSGGSININAKVIDGSGIISANGGHSGYTTRGGGGGGGRIALYFDNMDANSISVRAYGGSGANYGGAGTYYKKSSSSNWGTLFVDNNSHSGATTPLLDATNSFEDAIITNKAILEVASGIVMTLENKLWLGDNGEMLVKGLVNNDANPDGKFATVDVSTRAVLTVSEGGLVGCNELNVSSDGKVYVNGTGDIDCKQVNILDKGIFALNTDESYTGMHIYDGGLLTHTALKDGFYLTIADDLTIDPNGNINVNGLGYGPAAGPGAGESVYNGQDSTHGGGAGYGGKGGDAEGAGGLPYPDLIDPEALGSGGGTASWWSGVQDTYYEYGGYGGGKVHLEVGGIMTVNGAISANGTNGEYGDAYWGGRWSGGGGSGGTINFNVGILAGDGVITANAGNSGSISEGGGGGGGRIAFCAEEYRYTGIITADGGLGGAEGEDGTIYVKCEGEPGGELPVADAGPDQTVTDGDSDGIEQITLDGSASYDSDGTIISWAWTDDLGDVIADGETSTPTLSVGTHTITLTVTDNDGLTAQDTVVITVQVNRKPIADAGPDQTVDVVENCLVSVTLDGWASYDPDGDELKYRWYINDVQITTGVNPIITLPLGTHTIKLIVSDGLEDSEPNYVIITVEDGTPPEISCPADVMIECGQSTDPANTGIATAVDNCDGSVVVTHEDEVIPGTGNNQTIIRTWMATDVNGNSSSCQQVIVVEDTTAPELSINVEPSVLWPPNHKMVEVFPVLNVDDGCDNEVEVTVSVTSNEYDNDKSDGNTIGDIEVTEDGRIFLRAERSGEGNGRVYTITYVATDVSGNSTEASATVIVPLNK